MPLPTTEAGLRELELKCADRESPVSRRTVRQLLELALAEHEALMDLLIDGLANLVRCATEAGVAPNLCSPEHNTPLLVIAAQLGHANVVSVLLDAGADCDMADSRGLSAVHAAAAECHLNCVQLLLAAGADVKKVDACGNSPLISALLHKRLECARLLLPLSDLGHYSRGGATAFHAAVNTSSHECFELLLPHIADVDVRTRAGVDELGAPFAISSNRTALHNACQTGLFDMAKALLKRGASRVARDSNACLPLHFLRNRAISRA
jgi:ankyrin repeat protein